MSDKLAQRILPMYYGDRANWVRTMRDSISQIACPFNSYRMMPLGGRGLSALTRSGAA